MADKISKQRRSANMRAIRSKHTSPEIAVRQLIKSLRLKFKLHGKKLPGKPDLVFATSKKVIFVHGCFWHQHNGCKDAHLPKSNLGYWKPKLAKNKARDRKNKIQLTRLGWEWFVVWDCQLQRSERLKARLIGFLHK